MKCRRCSRTIPGTAKFCRYCGARTAGGGSPRPAQNQRNGRPGRRRQSGVNGYLILRIVLIVICVGLTGIGIWKIPGNIRRLAASRPQSSGRSQQPVGSTSDQTAETLSPTEAAAVHEAIARYEAEQPEGAPEPTEDALEAMMNSYHDMARDWFYVEPTGTTENEEVDAS